MTAALQQKIRDMTGMAWRTGPGVITEDQLKDIITGWDTYFASVGLTEAQQLAEFDGIMRARVLSGIVSLVPPTRITE